MDQTHDEIFSDRVEAITVPIYEHTEAGVKLTLRDMTLYLLNEEDFGLSPEEFDPLRHEHSIPKFEMARIYILLCGMTGGDLGFRPEERDTDPVYPIYEKAFQKLVRTEVDRSLFLGIAKVGVTAGFKSERQEGSSSL